MNIAALATWITAAAAGLYLLAIWLIEYDKEFQAAAATRLPPLLLAGHVLCAGGGLIVWAAFLVFGAHGLAWTAVVALVLAATLGTTMALRWVSVYRVARALRQAAAGSEAAGQLAFTPVWPGSTKRPAQATVAAGYPGGVGSLSLARDSGPPERNFPLAVVIGHGLFAVTTFALVLLAALGVGGS